MFTYYYCLMMNDGTEKKQVYYNTRQDMERAHNWVKWVWRAFSVNAVALAASVGMKTWPKSHKKSCHVTKNPDTGRCDIPIKGLAYNSERYPYY